MITDQIKKTLEAGLEGEAKAHLLYTFYARVAEEEAGFAPTPEIAKLLYKSAELFRQIAQEEIAHAYAHLSAMEGIGDTRQNLTVALEAETYEYKMMYPSSALAARADGNETVAAKFEAISFAEKRHADEFGELHKRLTEAWLKNRLGD